MAEGIRACDTVPRNRAYATFAPGASVRDIVRVVTGASQWQDAFPVIDAGGKLLGLLSGDAIRMLVHDASLDGVAVAADVMSPATTVAADDDLHTALERLLESGMRELPVLDRDGAILGLLDETDITRAYHDDIARRRDEASSEGTTVR